MVKTIEYPINFLQVYKTLFLSYFFKPLPDLSELYYGESYSLAGFRTSDSSLTFPRISST